MLRYLNQQMNSNRDFSTHRANRFKKRFPEVAKLVADTIPRPFRPRSVINSAMLEGVMVALLENDSITPNQLAERYKKLQQDASFERVLRGATTDTLTVKERIKLAKGVLGNVAN